jgi:nitrous oxidase accessory protein NosD
MQGKPLLAAGIALALFAADAQAATINVRPGANAIQNAVDRADSGDRLLVKRGTYREDVLVDKRLRIVGKKGKRPVIDGQCESPITIDVQANGVALRHLKVKGTSNEGGPGYTVNFIGIERGRVKGLVVKESCPDAVPEYGINLFSTGAIQVIDNRAFGGYEDAGIYVGSITDTGGGTLRVNRNEAFGNNRGIIIEEVDGPGAKVLVRRNFAHHNRIGGVASTPTGIFLHLSDGSRFVRNRTLDNGDYGFHVDPGSDDNIFVGNRSRRNPEGNFFDQGSGNCGAANSFSLDPC